MSNQPSVASDASPAVASKSPAATALEDSTLANAPPPPTSSVSEDAAKTSGTQDVSGTATTGPNTSATPPSPVASVERKRIHSLVVDTGPLIKNDPSVSTLLSQATKLFTIPAIISEIRDAETRRRVETTLLPFLTLRSPKPESVKFVSGFARRTGDLEVLSRPDIHLLALTYELELERNGGDGRLRNTPGQKHLNSEDPPVEEPSASLQATEDGEEVPASQLETKAEEPAERPAPEDQSPSQEDTVVSEEPTTTSVETSIENLSVQDGNSNDNRQSSQKQNEEPVTEAETAGAADDSGNGSDSDGDWITPSNLKKHVAKSTRNASVWDADTTFLEAAILTSDFAMQNVALRMNLHLISPALSRITQLKTFCLRCHGCFHITRDMTKKFCPSCGQPHLIRTSCSTDANGTFRVHLKRNFQWNNRGNVYSVPKPIHGSASGKLAKNAGGGKNGWGQSLILAEDQREYTRAKEAQRRTKTRDLMDDDYLPNLLSGNRRQGDRIRVGAGRNVNSKKR